MVSLAALTPGVCQNMIMIKKFSEDENFRLSVIVV
mgnify:CR=1 FL=1